MREPDKAVRGARRTPRFALARMPRYAARSVRGLGLAPRGARRENSPSWTTRSGQCEDLSNPPASEQPGGGAQCGISQSDAAAICPVFTATGPYPANCANFNQLGFRVPFIAVSPFSKPRYVSHTVGDHASLLALIEKRFLSLADGGGTRPHLTARDQYAATLEDMFDFKKAPSMNASVPTAPPPTAGDPGCS